ncbi:MAG: alpha/beta hydrolase domain-containing protein [Sulfurifustaceae bacterium]
MNNRLRAGARALAASALVSAVLGIPTLAEARITRIQITQVESPAFGGASFGDVGPYEKLIGRAFGEVDPNDPKNKDITDIALAPRNARGNVEYDTGIIILRPVDPSKGNHRLFYELSNRGVILALRVFNDSPNASTTNPTPADAGNGFLMRQGYDILFTGWDLSSAPGGTLSSNYPIAKNPDGTSIVGPSVEEFVFDNLPPTPQPLTATLTYPAASLDTTQATLTVRTHYSDAQTPIPPSGWQFVNERTIQLLPAGTRFEAGRLYELEYQAKDPKVAGLALAAVRDVTSFLRYAGADDTGAANPLAGQIDFTIGHGVSQPARLLHDFVHLGFNRDESNRQVLDGILNYIAGPSSGFFNYRFAQPFRTHRQHIGRWTPERIFPFTNLPLFDPVTHQFDGFLLRCGLTRSCPKILEANSGNEYWVKGGSLLHTDTLGRDLVVDPPNVRYYHFASRPHSSATGRGICEQERNPLGPGAGLRALLVDLDEWISDNKHPPHSELPRRFNGTLVRSLPQSEIGFPNIPGVRYTGLMSTGDLFDFGPQFKDGILDFKTQDGVIVSPVVASPYPVFVPKTDADGNEIAGVRFPDVEVPVATYTGYGFRAAAFAGPDLCDAFGQSIPFKKTKAERDAAGDPRPSLEERYPTHDEYVKQVTKAAEKLEKHRFLLQEDVDRYIQAAEASSVGN